MPIGIVYMKYLTEQLGRRLHVVIEHLSATVQRYSKTALDSRKYTYCTDQQNAHKVKEQRSILQADLMTTVSPTDCLL